MTGTTAIRFARVSKEYELNRRNPLHVLFARRRQPAAPGGVPEGGEIDVAIRYRATHAMHDSRFVLGVSSGKGLLFLASMLVDGRSVTQPAGEGMLRCRFQHVPLMLGAYQLFGEVWDPVGYDLLVRGRSGRVFGSTRARRNGFSSARSIISAMCVWMRRSTCHTSGNCEALCRA